GVHVDSSHPAHSGYEELVADFLAGRADEYVLAGDQPTIEGSIENLGGRDARNGFGIDRIIRSKGFVRGTRAARKKRREGRDNPSLHRRGIGNFGNRLPEIIDPADCGQSTRRSREPGQRGAFLFGASPWPSSRARGENGPTGPLQRVGKGTVIDRVGA